MTQSLFHEKIMAGETRIIMASANEPLVEYDVGENATVHIISVLAQDSVGVQRARLQSGAKVYWYTILLGGNIEQEISTQLLGVGAVSYHYGLCFGKAQDRFMMNYWNEHQAAATTGHIIVHGVLFGQAYANFKGNIKIAQTGHKTTASLTEHVLLLGERSRSAAVPQLEINTNDVQAAHSAAATKIDEEQLFYLASRGISAEAGKQMIVRGFLEDIISHLPDIGLQDEVRKQIEHNLLYVAE
ncbi:MAG: hypothetical protein ACD_43C00206G0004 [uncultured bacterium]|nr:MAG: hypothetical protein ACD_43C00206G0004 [uncultured bacterium]